MSADDLRLDFSRAETASLFAPVDDAVMGGRSASRLEPGGGFAVFRGVVSLARGGGFASVRSAPVRLDLAAADGIWLRVRGDGRTYKVNLRTDTSFDGVTYQAAFTPSAGAWEVVALPFASFRARFRGRSIEGAPPVDPSRIATVGFLVSDRQEGPFRLEIAALGALAPSTGSPDGGG